MNLSTPFRTFDDASRFLDLTLGEIRERQSSPTLIPEHPTTPQGCGKAAQRVWQDRIRTALLSLPHLPGAQSRPQRGNENTERSGHLDSPGMASPAISSEAQNNGRHHPPAQSPQTSEGATTMECEAAVLRPESSPSLRHSQTGLPSQAMSSPYSTPASTHGQSPISRS